MKLNCLAHTHIGRRENNEDAYCAAVPLGLFAVADGMGGYEGGEVASRLAIESLSSFVQRNAGDQDVTWPYAVDRSLSLDENLLAVGVRLAHDEIAVRRTGILSQMGATLAAMIVRDGRAIIGHVGDSRVYRLRGGQLTQLTRDHSFYEELVATGAADVPPRHEFRYANMITRALGIAGPPEIRSIELASGDLYLLCTDGLTDPLGEAEIAELLRHGGLAACRRLVDHAYVAGGRDNITAVVVACE